MEHTPEIEVEDGENYRGSNQTLGFREIVLEQYRRCCIEGSKEMWVGGLATKIINGVPMKIDCPNQREVFINCVKMLEIILSPIIKKDKKTLKELEDYESEISSIKSRTEERYNNLKKKYSEEKKLLETYNRHIRDIEDELQLKLVDLHRVILVTLSSLMDAKNYFEEASATGG